MRPLKFFVVSVITLSMLICSFLWLLSQQGASDEELQAAFPEKITIDDFGVPTIQANDQREAAKIQGYVVASQRLWQMDIFRRSTVGRLAEVFGQAAASTDIERRKLGISRILKDAVPDLPEAQRTTCEAFAEGVNQFISSKPWRWGIEFVLLRYRPENWTCQDSLAVLMMMAEDLSGAFVRERNRGAWAKVLPADWFEFLFTNTHPWNQPFFGHAGKPDVPTVESWLAKISDLKSIEVENLYASSFPPGSNSWVYRGQAGVFVANDPHLRQRVPQIWYALRVFFPSTQRWQAGVTIPGIPGVVIGMNDSLAWGITNTGEDVDDIIDVRMDKNSLRYLSSVSGGQDDWQESSRTEETVVVRGSEPQLVSVISTEFGPVVEESADDAGVALVRRWIGFEPKILRLPAVEINSSRDWESFNQAVDEFSIPAQNLLYADREANIGYRVSGRGIVRKASARIPVTSTHETWRGLAPASERRRMLIPKGDSTRNFLATANQRIWTDAFGHDWSADDRVNRINDVLSQRRDLDVKDMEKLQHDTFSRMSLVLLNWIMEKVDGSAPEFESIRQRWNAWSGKIEEDPTSFAEAAFLEVRLTNLLLTIVKKAFAPDQALPSYVHLNRRGWLLQFLNNDDVVRAFGLESGQVAAYLVDELLTNPETILLENYPEMNRWRTQHPLAKRIPIIGRLFKIDEIPQLGSNNTVKVETPEMGASGRWIWCLSDPLRSVWNFPVGQSGHIASKHYRSFRKNWRSAEYVPVFPEKHRPQSLDP